MHTCPHVCNAFTTIRKWQDLHSKCTSSPHLVVPSTSCSSPLALTPGSSSSSILHRCNLPTLPTGCILHHQRYPYPSEIWSGQPAQHLAPAVCIPVDTAPARMLPGSCPVPTAYVKAQYLAPSLKLVVPSTSCPDSPASSKFETCRFSHRPSVHTLMRYIRVQQMEKGVHG
jgi:hypothetical protein